MPEDILIFEMGPRDGLQNEARHIPTADKIELVNRLSTCGLRKIEVTSFVSPKWVPQLADAAEVMTGIVRHTGIAYTALTPNEQGLDRAIAANANEVAVFAAASEAFSTKNINCSIDDSLARFAPVIARATELGIPVRGYVSCVTHCPYDGPVPPGNVARVAEALRTLGCYEISLGDTIGAGTPETIDAMLQAVLNVAAPSELAAHYHDTQGRALDNITASLSHGIRTYDSAVAGLGGCPYAPGAKGNVATEAVVRHLEAAGFSTGLDMARLLDTAAFAKSLRQSTGEGPEI